MTTKLAGDGPLIVVDDDPFDIEILHRCFNRSRLAEAYELLAVGMGPQLLAHMELVEDGKEPMPSIVLLDINMPMMNGFEVLREVRSREQFRSVPTVVFVSNSDNDRDVAQARDLGASFVEKFMDIEQGVVFFDGLQP